MFRYETHALDSSESFFTTKPRSRWVYENTGSKRRYTDSAAERGALENSENLFSFKMGFEEIRG